MHFDDRLATVLRVRADGEVVSRIQYRQLLDLLGTSPSELRGDQIDAAYTRLADLSAVIPAQDRVAMLREAGMRLRSPRLVAALAADDTTIALAAVQRAQLGEDEWLDLIPALPVTARGIVRHRRDLGPRVESLLDRLGIRDRGLPGATIADEASVGIGAIVRRIEAYRRARQDNDNGLPGDAPRLPLGEEHMLRVPTGLRAFDFATDTAGRIVWADPGAAPMAVGLQLFARTSLGVLGDAEAFLRRQPVRAMQLVLEGSPAISGEWQLDAAPSFDPVSGRFTGYSGRLRRPAPSLTSTAPAAPDSDADRIRQLLHELRTPVNAIQGFAEIIQQQLFGPTPHEYRALAANIAGDSARILAAFDELERLAKLDSGALEIERGECDLAAIVTTTVEQLAHHTGPRGSGFAVQIDDSELTATIAQAEGERIVWRLLATLAGASRPGEVLKLRLRPRDDSIALTIALPAALAERDDAALFGASVGAVPQAIAAGMFGVGFALRLAASEARAAGGVLERRKDKLRLVLPGLTRAAASHSQGAVTGPNA
ncbi:MAG TPA: histidine kinase dimerization/phospho-acceptor domain-containing protein [Novosphingobium sp.]|nr:histidine kinase dimerization/phospho-acceptor domain-containing protein [Novosphingobium sp.]